MKVVVAGCRDIFDYKLVCRTLNNSPYKIDEIISGGAKGIDTLAVRYAKENKIPFEIFEADWDTYGKLAGPIRNAKMAVAGDALIAIWDNESRGTRSMIREMKSQEKPVLIVVSMKHVGK